MKKGKGKQPTKNDPTPKNGQTFKNNTAVVTAAVNNWFSTVDDGNENGCPQAFATCAKTMKNTPGVKIEHLGLAKKTAQALKGAMTFYKHTS